VPTGNDGDTQPLLDQCLRVWNIGIHQTDTLCMAKKDPKKLPKLVASELRPKRR